MGVAHLNVTSGRGPVPGAARQPLCELEASTGTDVESVHPIGDEIEHRMRRSLSGLAWSQPSRMRDPRLPLTLTSSRRQPGATGF